ncbi:hypothetical protein JG688_00012380 [Phytophthora aleatoria]|uniref:Uncharacterized protein n=1 Tax=Phytophthora aleatoria TaxID=2496075 RepID=A0A8J5IQ41_9STRA|nr:hypothetical protein JG688_00012380 [Phytophthora aleatoria]
MFALRCCIASPNGVTPSASLIGIGAPRGTNKFTTKFTPSWMQWCWIVLCEHLTIRDAIEQLLLQHGARLFRRDSIVIRSGHGPSEQIMLRDPNNGGVGG